MSSVIFSLPKAGDLAAKSLTRSVAQSDDTFMNMLNEKLQARTAADSIKSKLLQRTETSQDKNVAQTDETSELKTSGQPDSVKEAKAKSQDGSKADRLSQEEDSDLSPAEKRKKIEETLSALESLVAMLEELLARLQAMSAETETQDSSVALEALDGQKTVDLAELLRALIEGNTEKLKEILESLNGVEQPQEFQDLLKSIQELISKISEGQEGENFLMFTDVELVEGASREELIAQLREQANAMIQRLKERITDLRQSLESLPDESVDQGEAIASVESQSEGQPLEENALDKSKEMNKAESVQKEDGTEEKPAAQLQGEPIQVENTLKPEDSAQPQAMVADNTNSAPIEARATVRNMIPLTQRPMAQSITNQVMMKVKLMAGENKQEMEMMLKPESLGKLSLKIIHERGEVVAKLTAENEQVKGILESNMQLLKDALEKNGFTVQSLSVSVGNGNKEGQASQDLQGQSQTGTRNIEGNTMSTSTSETLYTPSREYLDHSSQINLTA